MQGGQLAELELQLIALGDLEVPPPVPDPFREGDLICLENGRVSCLASRKVGPWVATYDIVVDTVDGWVRHVGQRALLSQVVLDVVDAQMSNLVERPGTDTSGKLQVPSRDSLAAGGKLNLGVEPLVLEHFGGAHDGEAGRVTGLEGGNKRQLLAGSKHLVDNLGLLLLVVDVGSPGRPQDGRQEGTIAQGVAETAGEGDQVFLATAAEVVLGVVSVVAGSGHEDDIVEVGGGLGIVVEVVNHQTGSLGGDVDVQLEKESVQGGGDGLRGAQGKQDVSAGVEEVEDLLGSEVGTESWDITAISIALEFMEI